ncbi:MAG: class I SAM-dependent methyltransferase [Spirochaetia bacterium]|nr:class I SAM-dependent methyltransferase [Spirochaetia bacterium]
MAPIPTEAQLSRYYAEYSNAESIDLSVSVGSRYPRLRKLFHFISGDVDPRDFIKVPIGARVLDYGCGLAGYLNDFHNRGIRISGAEVSGEIVKICQNKGLDVHEIKSFSRIPFKDNEFDIVYLMQVFEHLRDPHIFMEELFRIMKTGGCLYLALPNSSSIWRKVFKKNWVSGWFAPFHLFHFNKKSLSTLAVQHGFDVVKSWSQTPESWFRLNLKALLYPEENQLDSYRSFFDSRIIRYLVMLLLRIIDVLVTERDCLVIHLKKKN